MKNKELMVLFAAAFMLTWSGILAWADAPHAGWIFGKVSMILDNGTETHVYLIPIKSCPHTKSIIDVSIRNDKKSEFTPFPSANDLITVIGNASGNSDVLKIKATHSWQIWAGDDVPNVFGKDPISGTVTRAGAIKGDGGGFVEIRTAAGGRAEAYIPPRNVKYYSQIPEIGDSVTISGTAWSTLNGQVLSFPVVEIYCPIQLMGKHLVIDDSTDN